MELQKTHIQARADIARWRCVTAYGELADSNNATHQDRVVGLTDGAMKSGEWGDVTSGGLVFDESWTWTAGLPVYLNSTVLSQTAPGVGFVQLIGWALTPQSIMVELRGAGTPGPTGPAGPVGPTGPAGTFNSGVAEVDFGAFPGATEMLATIADAGVSPFSLVLVWPNISDTLTHTADELYMEEFGCEVHEVGSGYFTLLVRPRAGKAHDLYSFNYIYA